MNARYVYPHLLSLFEAAPSADMRESPSIAITGDSKYGGMMRRCFRILKATAEETGGSKKISNMAMQNADLLEGCPLKNSSQAISRREMAKVGLVPEPKGSVM